MSPSGDIPQTPENKPAATGLAGVLKTFTSGRQKTLLTSPPLATSTVGGLFADAVVGQSLSNGDRGIISDRAPAIYGGPADLEQQLIHLDSGQTLPDRISAAETIRHAVEGYPLSSVMGIWAAAKDLTGADQPAEARRAGFDLLTACVKHADITPIERRQFFDSISAPCSRDDFHLQLAALVELTNHGKDLTSFEPLIITLLTRWLKDWFEASAAARAALKKEKGVKSSTVLGEETNLNQLFSFIIDVIRFNFKSIQDDEIVILLERILTICRKTTAEGDIRNSIDIMHAVITYGYIPELILKDCIEILCGVFCSIKSLAELTWNALSNLLKSHLAQRTIRTLYSILGVSSSQRSRNTNTLRGAVIFLNRLLIANGAEDLPVVGFPSVMNSFHQALKADSARLELEVMQTLSSFFSDSNLVQTFIDEPWSVCYDILVQCSYRISETSEGDNVFVRFNDMESIRSSSTKDTSLVTTMAQTLLQIISDLEGLSGEMDFAHKDALMTFFMQVHGHLTNTSASLLINYYADEHLCYPSSESWLDNCSKIINAFFRDRGRSTSVRLLVLETVLDVYSTVQDICSPSITSRLVIEIIDGIEFEDDPALFSKVVDFMVAVANDYDGNLFEVVLGSMSACLDTEGWPAQSPSDTTSPFLPLTTPSEPGPRSDSKTNVVAKGMVRIFIKSLSKSAQKTRVMFDRLLDLAKAGNYGSDARTTVLKLIFRLRSDLDHSVLLIPSMDGEGLAVTLARMLDMVSGKQATDEGIITRRSRTDEIATSPAGRTASYASASTTKSANRSISGSTRSSKPTPPLWISQIREDLPEDPPTSASPLVFSFLDSLAEPSEDIGPGQTFLPMNLWLEFVISMLQQGGDWEVYSYIIVHLGSQLTNHSLFVGALPQIQLLRSVICEQMKSNNFQDPPFASGLKKADIAVCLFHILTMLLSYRQHFAKSEQDDLVRAFITGVGSSEKTSKCCIHALTICCHELPLSVSKSLNIILQKMAQIITQAHVAVHVLEFLVCLSRLPELYHNFREDDYRTVFGICFRYLQYVRDTRQKGTGSISTRTSYASGRQSGSVKDFTPITDLATPSSAEDLPQYVYALAFHVVTFWFMSLKLQERPKYVRWITKNLVYMDSSGQEVIDEQSQVTIDMMQRVAYSDLDETERYPNFALPSDGTVLSRSWLMGLSIVTVETAAITGVSQITKRQSSATTSTILRLQSAPRPRHQVPLSSDSIVEANESNSRVAILPSHIFLLGAASSAGSTDMEHILPLPNDDTTARALSTFDRISTVDGHKVGVIYIGEQQTSEAVILANVTGNSEYTQFLEGLGTLTRLKGATFNTQGLDRENDMDGEYTYCWRDRVTEIVFHITTMMPTNLEHDPQCINKKRHTGNDFVNIIYNSSGLPFKFDTFPSDFNYVNIVITPESRASFVEWRLHGETDRSNRFFKVQVMSKPGFPHISPAAETKIVSGKSLPAFVRLLALNASVFSLVWASREGGDWVSSWRTRLREIKRLREKSSLTPMATPASSPPPSGHGNIGGALAQQLLNRDAAPRDNLSRRTSAVFDAPGNRGSLASNNTDGDDSRDDDKKRESLVNRYDFSRWT